MKYYITALIFTFSLLAACEKPHTAAAVIANAVAFHGGEAAMAQLEQLSFDKTTTTYDSIGNEKSAVAQSFFFNLATQEARLSWEAQGQAMAVSRNKGRIKVYSNDSLLSSLPADLKSYESLLNGGLYVYWQPYKLYKDPAHKTYLGVGTLQGKPVHILEVTYDNSPDVWQYYFEIDSDRLLANRVLHSGRYSLITNDAIEQLSGFSLASQRTSYRVNAANEILWKQASYVYEMD